MKNSYGKVSPGINDSDHEKKSLITRFNLPESDKLRQQPRSGSSTARNPKELDALNILGTDHDDSSEQHNEDGMDDNQYANDRSAYASNFAQFKHDQKKGNENAGDIDVDKKEFLKMLLQDQRSHHQKRFPFERSQFHQCIPHPEVDNCFITVQIVNTQLTLQRPNEFRKNLSMKYQEYDIKTFESEAGTTDAEVNQPEEQPKTYNIDEMDNDVANDFDLRGGGSIWTNTKYYGAVIKKERPNKLYEQSTLAEDVDAINGIKSIPYAQIVLNDKSDEVIAKEFAIIGLWKLSDNVFRCTKTVEVPNPMKREISNVKGTILQQVLYTSKQGIFFFNKDVEGEISKLHLNILSASLDKYEQVVKNGSILEKYITTMNNLPLEQQKQLPSPKLISRAGQNLVVFTSYSMHNKASTETAVSDEKESEIEEASNKENKVQDCQYPSIFFYDVTKDRDGITKDKLQWEILGADMFIDFPTDNEVMYLTQDKYQDKKWISKHMGNKGNKEKEKGSHKSEGRRFINVVDWGKGPTKQALNEKEKAAPVLQDKTSYRLFFGENKGLMLADSSILVEAHIHKREDQKRVTLVYRGFGAFTFTLENQKSLTETSKYTLRLQQKSDKKISSDYNVNLKFTENLETFTGEGVDQNNQKVKIKHGNVTSKPLSKFEGFYIKDNKQYDLVFENIKIQNGKITGQGQKDCANRKFSYKIEDGQIYAGEDQTNRHFKFTYTEYDEEGQQELISESENEDKIDTEYWANKAEKIAGTYGKAQVYADEGKCKDTFKKLRADVEAQQTRNRDKKKTDNTWTYEGSCNMQKGTFKGTWKRSKDVQDSQSQQFEFQNTTRKDVTFNLKIPGTKFGSQEIKAKLDCKTMTMSGKSDDEQAITIQSIEHVDNSQLTYFLQSGAIQFVCYKQNAYVCTELMCCPDKNETLNHGDAYCKTEMHLYNVSEKENTSSLEPKHRQKVKFLLNQSFMATQQNQSRQLWSSMPVHINRDNQIIGSVIYSQFGTDDMILEFFTSKFSEETKCDQIQKGTTLNGIPKQKEALDYSQQSLPQEWIIEYPILAYKHYSPENHKMCIINLAKNAPQKIINLGEWEFVNFVNHTQMVEKRIFNEPHETHSHVMFLAAYQGKTRLLSYKCEPWLNEDELHNDDDLLNQRHSLILFNGVLDEKNGAETKAGYNRRRFDADKLKNVQLLTKNFIYFKQFSLVMQFNHTIQSTSLSKPGNGKWQTLCGKTQMAKLDMVRGHNNQIYFAETSGNADKIRQLELHETNRGEMVIKEIYQFSGSHIIAFEADHENIQDDSPGNEVKQAFYIMDDTQKIFLITNEDGTKFNVEKTFNFAIHNKLRQVQNLQQQMWSNIHISPRTVTFDGCSYNLETKLESKIKLPIMYVGRDKAEHEAAVNTCLQDHKLRDCDEVYTITGTEKPGQVEKRQENAENKSKTFKSVKCVVCGRSNGVKKHCSESTCKSTSGGLYVIHEENCKQDQNGKWKVLSQHNMPMNTGLIAVGQRNNKDYCFALQPSPGSRKLDLVSSAQIPDIQDMIFVSNDHVLVNRSLAIEDQYCSQQFVHFATNGTVLYQNDEDIKTIYQDAHNLQLIGQSELCDRKKYLTFLDGNDVENSSLLVIKYNKLGQAKLEGRIDGHYQKLAKTLQFLKKWELYEQEPAAKKYSQPIEQEDQEWEKGDFPGEVEMLGDETVIARHKTWESEKVQIMSNKGKEKYKQLDDYKDLPQASMRKIDRLIEEQSKHEEDVDGVLKNIRYLTQEQEDWDKLSKLRVKAEEDVKNYLRFTSENTYGQSIYKKGHPKHTCVRVGGEMIYYATAYTVTKGATKRDRSEIPYRIIELPNEIEDSNFTFKVIVFECEDNYEWKDIRHGTDFVIIGEYLVHRHRKEARISVKKLDFDEDGKLSPKSQLQYYKQLDSTIPLGEMIGNDVLDQNHLRMYPVPNSSHLLIQMRQPGQKEIKQYKDLLQVSFRDKSIIYKLDHANAIQEVKFLSKMGQFIRPDAYTNTGFTVNISQDINEDDDGNTIVSREILIPNEYNNILFSKQQQIKQGEVTKRSTSGLLYQTFTAIDLEQLEAIRKAVEEGTKIPEIDEATILSTFEGSTIFSIYSEDIRVYEQIQNQLSARQFEDEEDLLGQPIENSYLRRLIQILRTPSRSLKGKDTANYKSSQSRLKAFCSRQFGEPFNDKVDAIGFQPIVNKSIHFLNPHFRDLLMQITMLSKENTLDMFVENLEDMSLLIEQKSIAVTNFFGDCFLRTDYCDNVHNADWKTDKKICVFRLDTSIITEDTANKAITKVSGGSSGRQNKMIELDMLKIDWIFQKDRNDKEQGQGDLVKTLSKSSNRAIFSTKLVTTLVEIFEEDYFWIVMYWCFIPFCVYFVSTVYYFSNNLIDTTFRASLIEPERGYLDNLFSLDFLNQFITIIGMIYFLGIEIAQMVQNRFGYLTDWWNLFDLLSIILNTILLIDLFNQQLIDIETTRVITFVAIFILWWKMIYWFRLFTPTAFYIKLIFETIKNAIFFLLIFVAVVVAFANAIYILNKNRISPDYTCDERQNTGLCGDLLFEEATGSDAIDSILNQYQLSLGEFGTNSFSLDDSKNSWIIWGLFVAATFLSQITILNMLITIMGDTYENMISNRDEIGVQYKIQLFADFTFFITTKHVSEEKKFIFAASPKNKDDVDSSWEGKVAGIKRHNIDLVEGQTKFLVSKMANVQLKIDQSTAKMSSLEENIERRIEMNRADIQTKLDVLLKEIRDNKQTVGESGGEPSKLDKTNSTHPQNILPIVPESLNLDRMHSLDFQAKATKLDSVLKE